VLMWGMDSPRTRDPCGSGLARERALKLTAALNNTHKKGRDPFDCGLFAFS